MRSAAAVVGALAPAVLAATQAKNVIYIVPDGYGQASQTMARDFVSLIETGTTHRNPNIFELAADDMVHSFPFLLFMFLPVTQSRPGASSAPIPVTT